MSLVQVEMPEAVMEQARKLAEHSHVPVDQIVADAIQSHVSREEQLAYLQVRAERGKQVTRERFLEILRKAPDVEPEPNDRIE